MQSANGFLGMMRRWFALAVCAGPAVINAFPPAPQHTIHGTARDQVGNPLSDGAEILFESSTGVKLKSFVIARSDTGDNYTLSIPMDAGVTADRYTPTALVPTVGFRIKVKIGNTTFLPIEMRGDLAHLGSPGGRTQIDLTLGEDSDGDGIPDAWERILAARLGKTIGEINPGDDSDGDGMSNLDEYLAGTYAFDDKNGFSLNITRSETGASLLEFTAVRGRSYAILGSDDLATWTPVSFRIPAEGANSAWRSSLTALEVAPVRAEPANTGEHLYKFYKLVLQ